MPTTTCGASSKAYEHVLKKVFELDHESSLHLALAANEYTSDFLFIINMSDQEIDTLTYVDDKNKVRPMSALHKTYLKSLVAFYTHHEGGQHGLSIAPDWSNVTRTLWRDFSRDVYGK